MDWTTIKELIGIASFLIAASAFYFARKRDTSEASSKIAEMIVEIRTMRREIGEMKDDFSAMRKEWRDDHDKIVSIDRDIKAIWRRIDNLKETEA